MWELIDIIPIPLYLVNVDLLGANLYIPHLLSPSKCGLALHSSYTPISWPGPQGPVPGPWPQGPGTAGGGEIEKEAKHNFSSILLGW